MVPTRPREGISPLTNSEAFHEIYAGKTIIAMGKLSGIAVNQPIVCVMGKNSKKYRMPQIKLVIVGATDSYSNKSTPSFQNKHIANNAREAMITAPLPNSAYMLTPLHT
jgi:hypothetical protein